MTRRQSLTGLAGILAAGVAPAAVVRSMIGARGVAMGGKNLPYDEELEYIESNGNQYIDTCVSGGSNCCYSISMMATERKMSWQQYFAGDKAASTPKLYENVRGVSPLAQIVYQTGENNRFVCESNTMRYVSFEFRNGDCYINGVFDRSLGPIGFGALSYYLFNSHGENKLMSYMRCYGLTMTRDGVIVLDFVPCIKDGVPCMYNKAVGFEGFYYNQVHGHQFGYKKKDGTIVDPT